MTRLNRDVAGAEKKGRTGRVGWGWKWEWRSTQLDTSPGVLQCDGECAVRRGGYGGMKLAFLR